MNDAKEQALCNIHHYRHRERLIFRRCIEANGVDGKALMHLDNLTNSHRDEHTIEKTRSRNRVKEINHSYRTENE